MTTVAQQAHSPEQVYQWLREEAQARGLGIAFHIDRVEKHGLLLVVPTYLAGDFDAYDVAVALQDVEDAWNNQEPSQNFTVILRPTGGPRKIAPQALPEGTPDA